MKRYKQANEGIHAPEELKERAARPAGARPYARWAGAVAAVLAVALIGGIALHTSPAGGPAPAANDGPLVDVPTDGPGELRAMPEGGTVPYGAGTSPSYESHALALAAYPEMAPYPDQEAIFDSLGEDADWGEASELYDQQWSQWYESRKTLRTGTDHSGIMDGWLPVSAAQFLVGAEGENRVYSPLNVYMALSMLAETTGDNSRQQILDVLQADSIEALRGQAAALWKDNYRDDGVVTTVLANSLWLRDDMTYSRETLDVLAQQYYASAFSGQMGSAEYTQALRDWLNDQTGGLLAQQAQGLELAPETVLALASTLYFKAAWSNEFYEPFNETKTFHGPDGDVECQFMFQNPNRHYYWGEQFSAAALDFQEGGKMWLLLPDEGVSVDDLLTGGKAMEFLLCDKSLLDENSLEQGGIAATRYLKVNLSLPKFDVSSDLDLIGGLEELGVTDVFDPSVSNFDPLGASTSDPLYVSQAKHAARVKVDEEGCEAAAYTVMLAECGAALDLSQEEVDLTLDRPFLFAITGDSGLPLFVGVVNQPSE